MSDFLTRLAARALGVATVVEPSLPALFAEPRDRVDGGLDVTTDSTDVKPSAVIDGDAPAGPRGAPALRNAALSASTRRLRGETPPIASMATAGPTGPGTTPRELRPSRDSAARDEDLLAPSSADRSLVDALPALATEPSSNRATAPFDTHTRPAAPPRPLVPRRQPPASSERFEADPCLRRQAPEPVPSVRITIGRVEVRAVAPQPQSERARRRQEAEAPHVSLSDYLKRGGPK